MKYSRMLLRDCFVPRNDGNKKKIATAEKRLAMTETKNNVGIKTQQPARVSFRRMRNLIIKVVKACALLWNSSYFGMTDCM